MIGAQPVGTVGAIRRYPVKSMQGEDLPSVHVGPAGFDGDRGWGVIDTSSGHVLTAKRVGRLLEARAVLTDDGLHVTLPDGAVLRPGQVETDEQLSDWLGQPVHLQAAGPGSNLFEMSFNLEDPDADRFEWPTPEGSFRDLAPVHVLSTAALEAAAAAHPDGSWDPHRFRPSILVETGDGEGFVDNGWVGRRLRVGDVVLEVTMPTIRCSLPTKAQPAHDLERDLAIFTSLRASNEQNLGAYADVGDPGTVHLGDRVELLAA